ncbi:MAG: endonuclease [Gammaproteobacteria bacterium]|nr:endonuclease [Gammaproteobacteria bacterium]
MRSRYGPQSWWPAETRLEVLVGAVLTQGTRWRNVELAISRLRAADVMSLDGLMALPLDCLAELIRPSGYFNVKARRLANLCKFIQQRNGEAGLEALDTPALRRALLSVNGIGPETADDILLYAFERPVFVVDNYTRRLFRRLGWIVGDEPYDDLRGAVELAVGGDTALFNELHALVVFHGKHVCRPNPRCQGCCLASRCPGRGDGRNSLSSGRT